MTVRALFVTLSLACLTARTGRAQCLDTVSEPGADSATVAQTVDAFHGALARGDSLAALDLLADDVVILEAGTREDRNAYRAHHLKADIAFARAVARERGPIRVTVLGPTAWAETESTSRGTWRGRSIEAQGVELMVLTRAPGGWRIRAIHWSGR